LCWAIDYLRRLKRPVRSDPRPSNPSRGRGEAVCGRLPAFWPAAAFWSALCELGALAADELLGAACSVADELGAVALLPAAAPAALGSVVLLGVELVEDELLGVVVLLGEVVLWFIPLEEEEVELELLGLVPVAAAPWSLGVVPLLVLLAGV